MRSPNEIGVDSAIERDEEFSTVEGVDDDTEIESISKGTYTIKSYGVDYTVDSLVKRMNTGAFIVPVFQRKFIWSRTHASRFIESLLMGLPIPGIFLYKRPEDGKSLVVDGQQRLTTLQSFCNGLFRDSKFRLVGVSDPWSGKAYDELDPDDRLRIDDSVIHAVVFSQESPKDTIDSIHFVFERINSGGIRLSPQEIRNCIAEGAFVKLTQDLNDNASWRNLYGPRSNRSKDQELITRVLAFVENADAYQRPMSTFLTKFAKEMNSAPQGKLDELQNLFIATCELCWSALGGTAFRPVRALNAAVMESVMAAVARRLRKNSAPLTSDAIKSAYDALLTNPTYKEGWERATADEEVVKIRTREATEAFESV
jgi:hypothetical protein